MFYTFTDKLQRHSLTIWISKILKDKFLKKTQQVPHKMIWLLKLKETNKVFF